MFNSIKNILFSTKLTALLLFVFAAAIGTATFIENDFGTPASKALVFNTRWFELVLFLLAINLFGNIFKYKMFRLEKLATLTFHVALIIIVIGAGITRYISFEGSMHIREGDTSNVIVSDDTFFRLKVDDQINQTEYEKKLYLNPLSNKKFAFNFDFKGNNVHVSYKEFIPNSIDTVIEIKGGKSILEIITVGQQGRVSRYIEDGEAKYFGNYPVAFNNVKYPEAIKILTTDTGLFILSPYDINYLSMDDQSTGILTKDTLHLFQNRRLYSVGNVQLVYKTIHESSKIEKISAPKENANGEDALVVDVDCNGEQKEVTLFGGKGYVSNNTIFRLGELNFSMAYGGKQYITPFSIQLNDFKLERYPGSMSPSSFESEVTLFDNRFGGVEKSQRIFMNNVLDYDGYRFFQSSYDQDELGTILSVNHDYWGTSITYLGYFLMFLGMIITLISKKSRFRFLINKIRELKSVAILIGMLSISLLSTAQNHHPHNFKPNGITAEVINIDHAEKFERILIQDQGGRIKPVQTMASEVLRKIYGKEDFNGQSPTQVLLGMTYNPGQWQSANMIKVKSPEIEKQLGLKDHYASFIDFFDDQFNYILMKDVEDAKRKRASDQDQYDKDLIKVDERVNICYMVFTGELLKIFPKYKEPNNTWYTSLDYRKFETHDSIFVKAILSMYFNSISNSFKENNWNQADTTLKYISDYQNKFGGSVIPDQSLIDAEITYNKINIFKKLFGYYGLIGLLMLFFLFADILSPKRYKEIIVRILSYLLFVLFLCHAGGLAARWYISGHAPWSNGYESMIYIAFITLLAGFIFSKSSKMTVAATAILSSILLMVAHLNFMDPEITNLVPVLKSYWLMIHVAVITGSYGFLGLGALLGYLNLVLMIFKKEKNEARISTNIKVLTYIAEMTLTVGLFMAAIGTFLGGVWANESWGRYWGWDPKETWALVIVLTYAIILHLRFIPKANSKFLFNLLAVLGYSTVIMTYLGVNFYLGGLHSYAKGDKIPIPIFIPITLAVVFITALLAYIRNKKHA